MNTEFVKQFMDLWIGPEIEKRREEGRLSKDFDLYAAQVIMNFDRKGEVRLNDEISAKVVGKPTRQFTEGEPVTIDEAFSSVESVELTDHDPNAGHLTLLLYRGEWLVAFDFRYNKTRIKEFINAAREFLDIATVALENGQLGV